ncbi:hypothetical protein Q1695_012961 [Nippostrongylus brasiliensis]|nr:hypothetical protein Q1695_012961 [Nippostrongylus brasiliensis]
MLSLAHLTEIDKDILIRSWNLVSRKMEALAVDIFEMIFEQAPDAKLMFVFMMRENNEDEKKASEFAFHALRFMQVIESTVNHLEDPETLDPLFLNLGKLHARHEEHLGFSSHYWSVFKECVLHHFRKAMKAERVVSTTGSLCMSEIDCSIILWREVLRFVIARMKTGLEANVQIRKANRKEVISGLMNDHDCHCWQQPRRRSISQMTQDLRQTEHSSVVPEYFLRMTTLEMEVEDPKHKFSS